MDISSSALSGALRVGVQVIVARKRPVLEIYQQLHNEYSPEYQRETGSSFKNGHRHHDVFIGLTLINIGGERAENITFEASGAFKRWGAREKLPGLFASTVPQLAPGQSMYLLRIDQHDVSHNAVPKQDAPDAPKVQATEFNTLQIEASYDGPPTPFNRLLRSWRRLRGKKQYESRYIFDPKTVLGDLPPPKYAT